MMPRRSRFLVLLAAGALLTACGGSSEETGGSGGGSATTGTAGGSAAPVPTVVATTSIWADVVSNLACDGLAEVTSLIPVGGDPHSFEPSMADRQTMQDAALVVANGLLLEEGLDATLDEVESDGTPVFKVGDHVTTRSFDDDDHADADDDHGHDDDDHGHDDDDHGHADDDHGHSHDDHGHSHEGDDPHIWQDPMTVLPALAPLADALVDAGLDGADVQACMEAYEAELHALDEEIESILAVVPDGRRVLITNHDALGYFADRYGFEVLGSVIPSTSSLAEANPAQMQALADAIETNDVRAIFGEAQHSTANLEAVAAQVGDVAVITLHTDSLGAPGSGATTYVELLRTNAERIVEGLG